MAHKNENLASVEPETYVLQPTEHCPNNIMPVLIYRDVLPRPRTVETAQRWIEGHGWERKGIVWPAVFRRHYHPNTHECYAIISGCSEVLMGIGKLDDGEEGVEQPGSDTSNQPGTRLTLREGDVIVHPAGTGHSSITEEGDYRYLSFFPEGSPKWITMNGDKPTAECPGVMEMISEVPMPQDPTTGGDGHLVSLWAAAKRK